MASASTRSGSGWPRGSTTPSTTVGPARRNGPHAGPRTPSPPPAYPQRTSRRSRGWSGSPSTTIRTRTIGTAPRSATPTSPCCPPPRRGTPPTPRASAGSTPRSPTRPSGKAGPRCCGHFWTAPTSSPPATRASTGKPRPGRTSAVSWRPSPRTEPAPLAATQPCRGESRHQLTRGDRHCPGAQDGVVVLGRDVVVVAVESPGGDPRGGGEGVQLLERGVAGDVRPQPAAALDVRRVHHDDHGRTLPRLDSVAAPRALWVDTSGGPR